MTVVVPVAKPAFGHANANFSVFIKPYKESISKEMNNDLNFHLHDQMSGWLRYTELTVCQKRHVPDNSTNQWLKPAAPRAHLSRPVLVIRDKLDRQSFLLCGQYRALSSFVRPLHAMNDENQYRQC